MRELGPSREGVSEGIVLKAPQAGSAQKKEWPNSADHPLQAQEDFVVAAGAVGGGRSTPGWYEAAQVGEAVGGWKKQLKAAFLRMWGCFPSKESFGGNKEEGTLASTALRAQRAFSSAQLMSAPQRILGKIGISCMPTQPLPN